MNWDNDIHYLLGQLSMADELVEQYSKYRTRNARKELKRLKAERQNVIDKINALSHKAYIYVPAEPFT